MILRGEEAHLPPSPQVLGQPDAPHRPAQHTDFRWGRGMAPSWVEAATRQCGSLGEPKDGPGLGDRKQSFLVGLVSVALRAGSFWNLVPQIW